MSKPLIIVESPAKARTIQKFLGPSFDVKASMGHVRDLPKSSLGVDVDDGFRPKYVGIKSKAKIISDLKKSASGRKVYLATDPDREGEAISWHLLEVLGIPHDAPCRVVFHEITRDIVKNALKSPRVVDQHLVDAQQARRVLDRLVGYKLSPLLWKKVKGGLSAGRVQSVAVRLICDREAEIQAFQKEEYWSLTAHLAKADGAAFQAKLIGKGRQESRMKTQDDVQAIMRDLEGAQYEVLEVKRKDRRRSPPAPFNTSSLQQEAARKLGFPVKRTMALAQQLYEGLEVGHEGATGLITYMRTDSVRISQVAREEARHYIEAAFGKEYLGGAPRKAQAKGNVQDAHEAIRPTSVLRDPESIKQYLNRDQYRLYRLIWERMVASQMAPAVYDAVSCDVGAKGHVFRATGSTMKFPGFTRLYIEGRDSGDQESEETLPPLTEGERLILDRLEPAQHFTQPPPRYTEAMLVKTLEEKGIGRPSTYAPIISTIQERGYVHLEDKKFVPTELGKVVVDLLRKHFPDIVDAAFTARLEGDLDRVEEGEDDWQRLVGAFYRPFSERLESADEALERVKVPDEPSDVKCDKCGRMMVKKVGRFGPFLACPGFPDCRNTKPIMESVDATCPLCGGQMMKKRSKKKRAFYGCENYPKCQFSVWNKPTRERCPQCGSFMIQRRGKAGTYLECANPGCPSAGERAKT